MADGQEYHRDIPHSFANNCKIMSTCISQFQNLILYFPHSVLWGLPANIVQIRKIGAINLHKYAKTWI